MRILQRGQEKKKPDLSGFRSLFDSIGRGGEIRTLDPLHPMQVRYQAALRPDKLRIIAERIECLLRKYRRNVSPMGLRLAIR